MKLLSTIKQHLVSSERTPRSIKTGVFRGLNMSLNLRYQTQLYLGLFERELHNHIKTLSTDIHTAIDIGAGEGEYTLYFLLKTSARRIFAFEPSAGDRAQLTDNIKLNTLTSDRRLELSSDFVGSRNAARECTLDSLSPFLNQPCLIKIDVEGGEAEILKGAASLLNAFETRWIIETHSKRLEEECVCILTQAGYRTRIVHNSWWRFFIPEQRTLPHNRWLTAIKA